jgi:gamma-glutamyltranspeptidase/glutathione hydrolase
MLGLVEPQSSGLGGGAFLVWYDAASGEIITFDGRETAPAEATGDLFLDAAGEPLPFFEAVVGGRSVGVPGVPLLMETIHRRAGKLPWAELLQPAIRLAEQGFKVSPRLARLIAEDAERLGGQETAGDYFFDRSGEPLADGATLKNPAYARTLGRIAEGGANAFYDGPIAEAIVETVRGHYENPGLLKREDLKTYKVIEREPVCAVYRGYEVCGMGPPSSGALTIGQILGMVSHYDLAALGPDDPESWRIIGDATRLAFADRGRYMADSDFASMPRGLLDAEYLAGRSELIRCPTALPAEEVTAGELPWDRTELRLDGISYAQPATSHFIIIDDAGNIASMTSSIENGFGSRLMVGGFLLNNQLTDFSFLPQEDGEAVANRVEPGKRPRSSMSPTIVLKEGKPIFALGSPGGSNIIPYVANTIVGLIDWDLDIQQAISRPHLSNRFGLYEIEAGTEAETMADDLTALGYEVEAKELNSGLHGVELTTDGLEGGADPRREGVAVGD